MKAGKVISTDWSATMPKGWEDRTMVTLVGPVSDDGFASNIVVTRENLEDATTVEEYAKIQADLMREEIDGVELMDERSIEINGLPAFQRLQRFAIDDQVVQQVQTFIMGDGIIYAITGSSSVEDFSTSIPAFKKFVETFELSRDE
jgi:hypothetical protein